jgi:hypothetical protein
MKSKEQLELERKLFNIVTPCKKKRIGSCPSKKKRIGSCPIGEDGEEINCEVCKMQIRLKILSKYCLLKVKGTSECTTPWVIE